jgi:hypothetical protein
MHWSGDRFALKPDGSQWRAEERDPADHWWLRERKTKAVTSIASSPPPWVRRLIYRTKACARLIVNAVFVEDGRASQADVAANVDP